MTGNDDGGLATKLIFPLFVLLGLLVMVGVSFWISIFILIFLGAIFLLYKNKTEITQRFPTLPRFTAKIPSWKTAAGWVVGLVIVGVILYSVGSFLSPATDKIFGKKTYISDASLDQGMDHWEGTGGAAREGGRFVIPPGGSLTRTKGFDKAVLMTVKIVNIKVDDPEKEGKVEVFIEDLYNYPANPEKFLGCVYQRNARFSFSVSGEKITSSNEAEFGNSMEKKKLAWYQDREDKKYKGLGHCFTCSVRLYYLISHSGSDGNFSYCQWKICPPGYWSRDIPRPYRVTIRNVGKEEISYDAVIAGIKE